MASPGFALGPGDGPLSLNSYFNGALQSGVWIRSDVSASCAALSAAAGIAGLSASALPHVATDFPIDLPTLSRVYATAA